MTKLKLIGLASASVVALSSPAMAQETGDAGASSASTGNAPIVVTARRRGEAAQDVPAVVQAVTADQLEQLELREFEDIASVVPGLDLASTLGGISTKATLRGVDFDGRASGSNATVELYRNDAVISGSGIFQAVYDVDRIEVLRGPQGTLKGRASPSGSISVFTKKPDLSEVGGYASGTWAERDNYNVNGALNIPLVGDKLGVRVAGYIGSTRGNNVRGIDLATGAIDDDIYDQTDAIRVSARADPFDGVLLLDFNYEAVVRDGRQYDQVESFSEVSSTAGTSPILIQSDDYLGINSLANMTKQKVDIYNWQAQLNLFGQSLIYLGQDFAADTFSLSPQDFAGVVRNPEFNGGFALNTQSLATNQVHEIRLQNEERVLGMFDYVVGYLNYKQASPTDTSSLVTRAVPSSLGAPFVDLALNLAIPIDRFREAKEESYFGNLTLHLGDRTEISGGVRRIILKQNSGLFANGSLLAAATDCRGFPGVAGCQPTTKKTIYTASASHEFTDNIMVYGSYGTSYRPGNVVIATAFTGIGPFLGQFIRPPDEDSESFEVGVKTSWFNDTLLFNVTGYHQKFDNFAFRPGSPVLALTDVYAPGDVKSLSTFDGLVVPADAKVDGIEAELSWIPSDSFSLSAVAAYADGKISDALFPCVDLNNDNVPDTAAPTAEQLYAEVGTNQVDTCLSDTNPGAAPKFSASLVAEYSREVSTNLEGFIRGFLSYKGNNQGVGVNPLDSVSSHGILDLFLGLRDPDGGWNITLYGKNILDTHRVLTRTDAPLTTAFRFSAPVNATQYLGITTTPPQEFGITARIAFGSR